MGKAVKKAAGKNRAGRRAGGGAQGERREKNPARSGVERESHAIIADSKRRLRIKLLERKRTAAAAKATGSKKKKNHWGHDVL